MISDEAYRDLEEAVGPENASREPAVLDGYAWQPTYNDDPVKWVIRPAAVVLPASTEEVQAVVRTCNKQDIKFKAFSTGWGVWNGATSEDVVMIDLRRMNRILEIDEKNMYALVEPYVNGAELQSEVMKSGLNTHIIGAGPNCSVLAGATAMAGVGWDGMYMSHSARNVLGVEWVLPTGEILRLGSPGSDRGWFSGDGPGPSLRGIMRGYVGAQSGHGVFTKCAVKLFNWPGPSRLDAEGVLLDAKVKIPENFRFYMCFFPDMKRLSDAVYQIGDAEIGYITARVSLLAYIFASAPRLYRKLIGTRGIRTLFTSDFKHCFEIMLVADSEDEMEYQEEVLRDIVVGQYGIPLEMMKDTPFASLLFMSFLRVSIIGLVFRVGGLFGSALPRNDAWDSQANWADVGEELKRGMIDEGRILDDFCYNPFMINYENNAWAHCEEAFIYDYHDPKHVESIPSVYIDFTIASIEQCMETMMGFNPAIRSLISPLAGNYNEWQKKISSALDPGSAADSMLYCGEAEFDFSKVGSKKRKRLQKLLDKFRWTEPTPPEWDQEGSEETSGK